MKIFSLLIIIFGLYSCSGFKEAGKVFRNEKIKTTDEFLVKKKEPLVMPPDYNEIPKPGTLEKNHNKNEKEKIQEILKVNKENKKNNPNKDSTIEKTILNEIKR